MNSQTDLSQAEIVAQLQAQLTNVFSVVAVDVSPEQAVRFRGHLLQDSERAFDELSYRFELLDHTPMLAQDDKEPGQDVLVAMRGVVRPKPSRAWINLALFLATVLSTLLAGSLYEGGNLLSGAPFAFTLLLILGTHEFGHYFAARHYQAAVTLPYFIPMPILGLVGTMGAVIQLRSPIRNRKQLFDIGVAGPLAGLVVAIPLLIYGLSTSPVQQTLAEPDSVFMQEGNSLLYLGLKYLVHGKILPRDGLDVSINSVTFAAWFGLLVTSLNLLPMGQLDGGHTAYALLGRRAWRLAAIVMGGLLALGAASWSGWFMWSFMIFIFGWRHPPPLNDHTPLDQRRKVLGVVMLVIFILVFTPVPLKIITT